MLPGQNQQVDRAGSNLLNRIGKSISGPGHVPGGHNRAGLTRPGLYGFHLDTCDLPVHSSTPPLRILSLQAPMPLDGKYCAKTATSFLRNSFPYILVRGLRRNTGSNVKENLKFCNYLSFTGNLLNSYTKISTFTIKQMKNLNFA